MNSVLNVELLSRVWNVLNGLDSLVVDHGHQLGSQVAVVEENQVHAEDGPHQAKIFTCDTKTITDTVCMHILLMLTRASQAFCIIFVVYVLKDQKIFFRA